MRAAAIAIALGAVLATSASASAQSPQVFRTDGGGRDTATALATDPDGNSYIAGSVESATGASPFAVVKLGPDGTRRFTARYDGSLGGVGGQARAVAVDGAGNVYAAGYVSDGVIFGQNLDYLVAKFSPDGTQRWAHRFEGAAKGRDEASGLAVDGAGNVYVTGGSTVQGASGESGDWATLKLSPDGALQWERRIAGADVSDDFPVDMAILPDGDVVVTGTTQNRGDRFTNDAETVVYDPQGAIVWRARFSDTAISHEVVSNLDVDAAGRIAIAVTSAPTASPETGEETPVTLRYDSRGVLLQTIRAGGHSVDVDPAGNVYVAGFFHEASFASVAKYDAAGNRVWATPLTAGINQFLVLPRVAADSTGAVTVAGTALPLGSSTGGDYLTVRFAPDGRELSRHRFDGGGTFLNGDDVAGLTIGTGDAALVTGTSSTDGAGSPDIVTLRFGAGATPPPAAPAAPSQLEAAAITRREIRLRWRDNAGDEDGVRIERCAGSNCTAFAQVAVVGPNATSFVDSGLARNTTHRYRVRAFNAGGASAFSNTASARTSR